MEPKDIKEIVQIVFGSPVAVVIGIAIGIWAVNKWNKLATKKELNEHKEEDVLRFSAFDKTLTEHIQPQVTQIAETVAWIKGKLEK